MFLVNSRFPLVSAAPSSSERKARHPSEALLLPKLRRHLLEFLNHRSPDRLGILYLSTCVGLGYGRCANSLAAFLGNAGLVTSPGGSGSVSRLSINGGHGLPSPLPTRLPQDNHRLGSPTRLRPRIARCPDGSVRSEEQPLSNPESA